MSNTFFWFRRDLRLDDNAGLYHALQAGKPVMPVFIFDTNILDKLEDRADARVEFILNALLEMQSQLVSFGSSMIVKVGKPLDVWEELLKTYPVSDVYTNRDYEPYALERDALVADLFDRKNVRFQTFKDHVIFEKGEVVKSDGTPYTVFTPYSKKWLEKLNASMENGVPEALAPYSTTAFTDSFWKSPALPMPSLESLGFQKSGITFPDKTIRQGLIKEYAQKRNFPALPATSRLGVHFRFGTISIREKALKARTLSDTFLNELIWRDFYSQILAFFPHVASNAFRPAYDRIPWLNNTNDFERWCEGTTGYPLVDAGMRELNATGFMHNRVRMVVASFLTKHLMLDWRLGEAYFAKKLLDFDLASNSGGWQWAAGCGTDAAPYFRIFNPQSQLDKFDKDLVYVKRWVPEYGTAKYPKPIVDHVFARDRYLSTVKKALNEEVMP